MSDEGSNAPSASPGPEGTPFGCTAGELIRQRVFDPPIMPGQQAALGHYAILQLIGAGGMGCVFLARDTITNAKVALKVLKPELAVKPLALRHFLREARFMQKLQHPHIMPVMEVSDREERPYFVMPFMEQGSLAGQLHPGQPVSCDLALRVGRQMAEALQCAHARGVVHRDLKPGNILLGQDRQAYLSDFGLARKEFNDSLLDLAGNPFGGTAPYVAPEVARGEPGDRLSDLYSLGAVLFEMLTGRAPFDGQTTQEILDKIKAGPPKPVRQQNSDVPWGLERIVEAAMAREKRQRYTDASDLVADLKRCEEGRAPLGPHGQWRAPSRWRSLVRRRPKTVFAAAVLVGILATGAWLGARQLRPRFAVVHEITRPGIVNWTSAILGDWEGDRVPELFMVVSNRAQVISADGSLFTELAAPDATTNGIRLSHVQDINGDGLEEAFLEWNQGALAQISIVNQMKFELARFSFQGSDITHRDFGYCATAVVHDRWTDLEADGKPELLAQMFTSWSLNPRGVCCFDGTSRQLRWEYRTAPVVTSVALVDLDGDGSQDLVFGSDALCNGNKLPDGTDDQHSYLYAVSSKGTLLWHRQTGGPYTTCSPIVLPTRSGERPRIYAWLQDKRQNTTPERTSGSLTAFDTSGNSVARFDAGYGILSCLPADLEGDGRLELLATDQSGMLHVLDPELNVRRSVQVTPNAYHDVQLFLVACTNLSRPTSREVVLQSAQVEYRHSQGPGNSLRAVNLNFYHDNALIVLDSQLRPVARYVMSPLWREKPGWTVRLADWDRDGIQEIVSLSRKVRVLKLRRPWR